MKKVILLLLGLLLVSSSFALVTHVWPHEIEQKKTVELYVTVFNHGNTNIRNARVNVMLPYQDSAARSTSSRIRRGAHHRFIVEIDVPKTNPDYYPVYVRLSDEEGQVEKKGTWIYIE